MKMNLLFMYVLFVLFSQSCDDDMHEYRSGDLSVRIDEGSGWLHDYPLFLGISKKNPPQVAIWVEDTLGNYLSTVYVSKKTATQGWVGDGRGKRRPESLPHWSHSRGVCYSDGLYCPTKKEPLTDGLTGATPRSGFNVRLLPKGALRRFRVKVEVNHSTDFNERYSKSLPESDMCYSGGSEGSGQPSLVYAADVDLDSPSRLFVASLVGHGHPSGANGSVSTDISGITSALSIVKQIIVEVK